MGNLLVFPPAPHHSLRNPGENMYGRRSAIARQACARTSALDMVLAKLMVTASASRVLMERMSGPGLTAPHVPVLSTLLGLVLPSTRIISTLGRNAQIRVFATAALENVNVLWDMRELHASALSAPTTVTIRGLAGPRSISLARLAVSTMLLGTP